MNLASATLCSKLGVVRLSSRIVDSFPHQANPNHRFLLYPINQIRLTIPPHSQTLPSSSSSSSIRRFSKMVGGSEVANNGGLRTSSPIANGGAAGVSQFRLSPSSLLKIQKGDITCWSVDGSSDAIVNPANERMLGGGGADGAIHRAAGPELRAACYDVPEVQRGVRCPTGEARITPGFRLPASHVIHTVGPIYYEADNPAALLRNAYRNSLCVAREKNIQYVAFPAISCGVYGYPYDEAATVAISTVRESGNDIKEVHFVLYADDIFDVWLKKAAELLEN